MRKGILALIGMILTLVFVIVAFVGPWYSISFMGVNGNYYLTKAEMAGVTVEYSNIASQMGDAKGVFDNTMYLSLLSLIMAVLALIAFAGLAFNFGKAGMMKKLGLIFGILTFIFALVAPLYFMTSTFLESYGDVGFWNEMGGPGYAWYLMIVAAIIALVSFAMVFMEKPAAPVQQAPAP